MNKEYKRNQRVQRKSFKKYRKYIGKIFLWGAIAVASAFLIPYEAMFAAIKGLLGESIAINATFFTQWGIVAGSLLGSVVNAIKANHERRKIDNAQDEEENIIDGMVNEYDKLKSKVDSLEKTKTYNLEENKAKTFDDKEKEINVIENVEEKEKKYVK